MSANGKSQDIVSGAVASRILTMAGDTHPKILVVDDDELQLSIVCDQLEYRGFEARRAANGAEALKILEGEWFPVILTDWHMPVINGLELTQRLRANGVMDTYVIMLTVLDTSFDYERAYEAGVDDYLVKKMPAIELFARIHAAFNTLNLRRALREACDALAAKQAV
jgi:DNA-binding response OmpR family regulator